MDNIALANPPPGAAIWHAAVNAVVELSAVQNRKTRAYTEVSTPSSTLAQSKKQTYETSRGLELTRLYGKFARYPFRQVPEKLSVRGNT